MEEIINSVMQSSENTNPNVLRSQLQNIEGGSGGGGGAVYATFTEDDNGTWSCDKTYSELKAAYDAGSAVFAIADVAAIAPMVYAEEKGAEFMIAVLISQVRLEQNEDLAHFEIIQVGVADGAVVGQRAYYDKQGAQDAPATH